jgi:hypothetical protein
MTIAHQYCSEGRGKSSVFSFTTQERNTEGKTRIVHIMVTENDITTELFVIEKEEGIVANKT